MENNADVALETTFFQMNMSLLAFHVDITYINESMISLKYNGKK